MSMRSWCFDSVYDETEQTYDREYGSADVREVIKHIIGDGIYRDDEFYGEDSLRPYPYQSGDARRDSQVIVKRGACFINGALGVLDEDEELNVSEENKYIIARFSTSTRSIELMAVSSVSEPSESQSDLLLGQCSYSNGHLHSIGFPTVGDPPIVKYVTGLYDEARVLHEAVDDNASAISRLQSGALMKSGGTMNGRIYSSLDDFAISHSYGGKQILFGVGGSGTWRGIYDGGLRKWIFYEGNNDATCINAPGSSKTIDLQIDGTSKVRAGSTTLSPVTDNQIYLGHSEHRWKEIHAASSTIVTSDREQKKDIEEIPAEYEKMFNALKPVRFKFKDGDSGRFHTGFIAQEVEEAVSGADLNTKDFAGFVKEENSCGLRYEEFIAINTMMIQQQAKKIEEIEAQIRDLKGGE